MTRLHSQSQPAGSSRVPQFGTPQTRLAAWLPSDNHQAIHHECMNVWVKLHGIFMGPLEKTLVIRSNFFESQHHDVSNSSTIVWIRKTVRDPFPGIWEEFAHQLPSVFVGMMVQKSARQGVPESSNVHRLVTRLLFKALRVPLLILKFNSPSVETVETPVLAESAYPCSFMMVHQILLANVLSALGARYNSVPNPERSLPQVHHESWNGTISDMCKWFEKCDQISWHIMDWWVLLEMSHPTVFSWTKVFSQHSYWWESFVA